MLPCGVVWSGEVRVRALQEEKVWCGGVSYLCAVQEEKQREVQHQVVLARRVKQTDQVVGHKDQLIQAHVRTLHSRTEDRFRTFDEHKQHLVGYGYSLCFSAVHARFDEHEQHRVGYSATAPAALVHALCGVLVCKCICARKLPCTGSTHS